MRLGLFLSLLAALILGGCANPQVDARPIEGTTYRISRSSTPVTNETSRVEVKILTGRDDCEQQLQLTGDDLEACLPRVDRATGETTLSFLLKDSTMGVPLWYPLNRDQVIVSHNDRKASSRGEYELIPHGARRTGQLFILVIDGSSSMYEGEPSGADQVYDALRAPRVVRTFFPEGADYRTGVVLLRFTSDVHSIDGGDIEILTRPKAYKNQLVALKQRSGGFTHLYEAAAYAATDLLRQEAISSWLQVNNAEATIVLLTDGFNNEHGSDTCATNVPRLEAVLETLRGARATPEQPHLRPTLYTVGFGRPILRDYEFDRQGDLNVRTLCRGNGDETINNGLERRGIDNASLEWLADAGGGLAFVRHNADGLADVFDAAAAERYQWYTARYRIDGFYHRQSYTVRVSLAAYAVASSTVDIYPSGWFDAPSGIPQEDQWSRTPPVRKGLTFLMPLLGLLVLVRFLGPALFNARRAIFRRARRR